MDTKTLSQLGLNDSEINVYFALLELESSTVGPIVERAKVQDSKIYSILEKLKEKGLVSYVIKNNVKHFQASDPQNLIKMLDRREDEIKKQKSDLQETIIPQIERRRKLTEDKQEAIVYETMDGIKAAFNFILDSLRQGDEYQVFMLGETLKDEKVVRFFNNYHKKRIEKKVRVRLVSENQYQFVVQKKHKYSEMRIRFTQQKMPVGIFMFNGYVMTVVWGERPTAFLIKSRKNYEHYKEFFEDVWKKAKP